MAIALDVLIPGMDEGRPLLVQSTAEALRGGAVVPSAALGEAHRTVLDRINTLRGDASTPPESDARGLVAFLKKLDARCQIITRQLALEVWLADWANAED